MTGNEEETLLTVIVQYVVCCSHTAPIAAVSPVTYGIFTINLNGNALLCAGTKNAMSVINRIGPLSKGERSQ